MFEEKVVWDTAKDRCNANLSNLVSIHSEKEFEFIKNQIAASFSGYGIWTGLRGSKTTSWTWQDDSSYDWTNWEEEQPNGVTIECMYLWREQGYQWADSPCSDYSLSFLCEK